MRGACQFWRGLGRGLGLGAAALLLVSCDNNPWPHGAAASNTLFTAAKESSPRHLDPTASYWSNETPFTLSIYEPPYGYHYLKRPIELVAKSAREVVKPRYIGKNGQSLPDDAPADAVAESIYDVAIKPGILYQPHPAFALSLSPGFGNSNRTRTVRASAFNEG